MRISKKALLQITLGVLAVILLTVGVGASLMSGNEKLQFSVTQETFINTDGNNEIRIHYPQVSGLKDKSKERRINSLIFDDIMKVTEIELFEEKNLRVHFNYEIKNNSNGILSIFYKGWIGAAVNPGHGDSRGYWGTTIDLEQNKIVTLSDVINDFNTFYDMLLSDRFESITEWEGIKYKFSVIHDPLFDSHRLDSMKSADHSTDWYTIGDAIIVIIPSSNIYNEFSISNKEIKNLLHDYWKGIMQVD